MRLIAATGRYLGEGFDDPQLDTLILAMPFSWKGTIVQYAGRLHREHPGKKEVRVYDYIDANVPKQPDAQEAASWFPGYWLYHGMIHACTLGLVLSSRS